MSLEKQNDTVDNLTFTNRFMFNHVMKDPQVCTMVIETLLKIKIEKIEYIETEKTLEVAYKNHGIRLDVYVKDSSKIYDIEIQGYIEEDLPRRLRYYQSLIDAEALVRGENYNKLKECYVIFICNYDPFNFGLPCYHFESICIENRENKILKLNDGVHKLVFNSKAYKKENDVEIRNFLMYTNDNRVEGKLTNIIDDIVKRHREAKSFRESYMFLSDEIQYWKNKAEKEGYQQGIEKGQNESKLIIAKRMLKNNKFSLNEISELLELSLEQIENIK